MSNPGFLCIDGVRLETRSIGAPVTGTATLVFLHEGLGCVGMWRDFPDRLAARTGQSGFVYSRRGHGRSDAATGPASTGYHLTEALDVLPKVLDAADIERAVLIGHSDGGTIALIVADSEHADRVEGVITMAAHVFNDDVTIKGLMQAKAAYEAGDLREKLERHHGDNTDHVFWSWNDIWLSPAFRDWNVERHLWGITAPMLVIQGEDDHYGTEAQVKAIARQVSGPCETLMIPKCGHHPHLEKPDETLDAMGRFIEGLRDDR